MKIEPRQAAAFLRNPGSVRLVLLYGEDEGQIRERSQALTRLVAGSLNDPFLVAELGRDGWGQIGAEMTALSMIGGRRVVVVREATDAILALVQQAMRTPGAALLIVEAAGLGKGRLRSYAEATPDAAALACYPDEGRALTDLVRAGLAEDRVTIDPDALAWLAQTLGGDRAVTRGEIDKLALLAGPGGQIDMDGARACTGDGGSGSADDGILAALGGGLELADAGVEAAILDGLTGVAVLRMALGQLQKLHQARLRLEAGLSAEEAMRAMRPPVFYRAQAATAASLAAWSSDALLRMIEEARAVELACKRTGARQELLARRFVAGLARQARARRQARAG